MTDLNKLTRSGPSSVNHVGRTSRGEGDAHGQARQEFAGDGNQLPGAPPPETDAEVRREQLHEAMREVSDYVQKVSRELNFSIDEEMGRAIVTVIDETSGEIVRQIPPEDLLQLAKNLDQLKEADMKGILFEGDA